jgi:hypothetical protein
MWCVDCHTAFSWATGQLVNGVVHNPHYYEFLRKQGGGVAPRNAGDVPCGGVPYYAHLQTATSSLERPTQTIVMMIHRITSEIADQRIQMYQGHFNVNDNGDLGVQYLLKTITKEAMKVELAKREIKRNKQLAIRAILEMFVNTSTMMLNNIVNNPPGQQYNAKLEELRAQRRPITDILINIDRMIKSEEVVDVEECERMMKEATEKNEELKKKIATLKANRIAEAANEFQETLVAFQNLRIYVNDSLMGVSRMKNCSVPQIGEDWLWKAFNKIGPTARKTPKLQVQPAEAQEGG